MKNKEKTWTLGKRRPVLMFRGQAPGGAEREVWVPPNTERRLSSGPRPSPRAPTPPSPPSETTAFSSGRCEPPMERKGYLSVGFEKGEVQSLGFKRNEDFS